MKRLYKNHPDYKVLSIKEALFYIVDEYKEYKDQPSWDEFSDIVYAINRLIGALFGVKYIKLIPLDRSHIQKCNTRFMLYGHFRSKRHIYK